MKKIIKKIIGILSLSILIISSQSSYASELEKPTSINKFLHACQIALRNKLFSMNDAYQAAFCMGTLSGYIEAKVKTSTGSPGFTLKWFMRKAIDIDYRKSRTVKYWDTTVPSVLIDEVLRESGAKPCSNSPELFCVDPHTFIE